MQYQNNLTTKDWVAMFDAVTDMVMILAPDHTILMCNKAARDALNRPLDNVIGSRCYRLVHHQDTPIKECPCEQLLKTKSPHYNEYESEGRHYLLSAWPIFTETGEIKAMIHSVRDITAKKLAEYELIKAKEKAEESDRLKTAFLLNLSHEIRTPMNGILGFAQLLKEPFLTPDEQSKFIQNIEKSGARMLKIITALVNISKIESGQMEVTLSDIDVNKQIDSVFHVFEQEAAKKGLRFEVKRSLSPESAIIQSDKEKLLSVLNNLVDNAIKFTDRGFIEFGCFANEGYLEFFIADTGDGIEEKRHSIIFERFRQGSESLTRTYEGAGLGLSIAKSYVELLGGQIWFESEPGKGSTFHFTIPATSKAARETTETIIPGEFNAYKRDTTWKVLIVEDDESSAEFLSLTVKPYFGESFLAHSGTEALELFHANPDIDLVLMDIKLPEMDGFEVTRKIKELNNNVIIIVQTAYDVATDKEKAKEAGCDDYISKPIDSQLLQALITRHLARKTQA